jgi:thioredoxin 1
MRTSFTLGAAALAVAGIVQPAAAGEIKPFSTAAFEAAQRAGRPILVDVHAGWCPVCRAQAPILDRLAQDRDTADLVIFRLDYDRQKAERTALKASRQSTLIAYRGARETGRSVGETDPDRIAALVASTAG